MSKDLNLSCECGSVRGVLHGASAKRGERMRCYCRDCQSYAQHLGKADELLDAQGGTALFQTTSGGLEFTQGEDKIACLRLSPKGPLRWYASCCNTPLANTLATAKLPFLALLAICWKDDDGAQLGREINAVYCRDAHGRVPLPKTYDKVPGHIALRVAGRVAKARLKGEHKHSPFFDANSGNARAQPSVLSREERAAALAKCSSR